MSGARSFLILWFGQFVSLFGSRATGFALGVWAYQETGSASLLSLIWLAAYLPDLLLSPLAGILVDRWSRRSALLVSDAGGAVGSAALAVLAFTDRLGPTWLIVLVAATSAFTSLQWPAYMAATAELVPDEKLGRANGLTQLAQASTQLAAPALAGLVLSEIGLMPLLILDCATFAVALASTAMIPGKPPSASAEAADEGSDSLGSRLAFAWGYLRQRPGLMALVVYFASLNLAVGFVQVLITPLVLGFASEEVLGLILSAGGVGMVVGSLVMSAWGGPRRKIDGVLAFTALVGVGVTVYGLAPSPLLVGSAVAVVFFCIPLIEGSSQVIWQRRTAPSVQGRVFALRRSISLSSRPVGYLLAGPTADWLFEPLLSPGGWLAPSLGRWIGVGPGRGIAFMCLLLGGSILLVAGFGYTHRPLREVEGGDPAVERASG